MKRNENTIIDRDIPYAYTEVNALKVWDETRPIFDSEPQKVTLSDISQNHEGRLSILLHDLTFETCFLKKNPKKLFVFLSGPGRQDYTKAAFWRKSYSAYFEESSLYIEDPCNLQKNFAPTFFWGDNNHSYADFVLEIVEKFQNLYDIQNSDTIFLGESNTGFVALYCSAKMQGSQCLAFSPQFNLRMYLQDCDMVEKFNEMFDYDFLQHDLEDRIDISDLIISATQSKYFIVSNVTCNFDRAQIDYIFKKLNAVPKIGLNKVQNFIFYLSELPVRKPHLFNPTEGFCRYMYSYLKSDTSNSRFYYEFDALSKSLYWYRRENEKRIEEKKVNEVEKENLINENEEIRKELESVKVKLKKIKKSAAYKIGSRMISKMGSNNFFSYLLLPFIVLIECIKYKNKQK